MYGSEHDTPLLLSLHPRERHGRHLRSDMRSVQLLRTKSLETSNIADLFGGGGGRLEFWV